MLFQLINVTYAFLKHPVLKTAPNSVVNRVQVRAARWPEVGQDEFWCDLAKIFDGRTCTMVVMAMAAAGTPLH